MSSRRGPQVHGILVVDKPSGMTSHDVVARARRVFHTRKVGHAGTLDPMATGVLVLLFGEATKFSNVLTTQSKEYEADVRFGIGTDSLDADGKIVARRDVPEDGISPSALRQALATEQARTLQMPPAVSAIKVDGQRAYKLAREGKEARLEPRTVMVHDLELVSSAHHTATVRIRVSKGYYVRALARDLGATLGFPAHLTRLRRTQSGNFSLDGAATLPFESAPPLTPLLDAVRDQLPCIEVDQAAAEDIGCGRAIGNDQLGLTPQPDASSPATNAAMLLPPVVAALHKGRLLALLGPGKTPDTYRVQRGINDPGTTTSLPQPPSTS